MIRARWFFAVGLAALPAVPAPAQTDAQFVRSLTPIVAAARDSRSRLAEQELQRLYGIPQVREVRLIYGRTTVGVRFDTEAAKKEAVGSNKWSELVKDGKIDGKPAGLFVGKFMPAGSTIPRPASD